MAGQGEDQMTNSTLYVKDFHMTIQTLIKAVEQTGDNVMITDKASIIQYVNPAFQKTTGYSKAEVLGLTPKILQSGKHDKEHYEQLWSTILSGGIFRAQTINKNKKGESYIADQTISPIVDESGEITHFVSVWKDVTERIKLEEQLRIERQKLEEVIGFDEKVSGMRKFDQLIDFVVEKSAKILEADKCSVMLLDQGNDELILKGAVGLKPENRIKARVGMGKSVAGLVALEEEGVLVKNIETDQKYKRKNRLSYTGVSFISVPIKLHDKFMGVINVADKNSQCEKTFNATDFKILKDIAREVAVAIENVRLYKELNYLTVTDPLTQIYNFRQFKKSLHHEINRANRFPGSLCLMMIDVDDLKSYNDTFGHLEGNELLKKMSVILTENLREIDIACRFGGDEFAVILPETDVRGAEIAARKIIKRVEKFPFKRKITLSIGLAQRGNKMDGNDLIRKADGALYEAKEKGKNRVCCYG